MNPGVMDPRKDELGIEKTLHQYFKDPNGMSQGEVTVIDVRTEKEYQESHLPRALSIPMDELKKRLSEIPKSKEVIAYCRGPYCVLSHEAVELLRRSGFRARRMSEGVSEWSSAGLPVETGAGA